MPRRDREKQNEYQRAWYARNKAEQQAKVKANKHRYRKQWREFKATLSCINCGYSHPAALDFHHVIKSPDNKSVNQLLRRDAFKAVYEEIKKCVVLCANCHRVHHYDEHVVRKQKKKRKKLNRRSRNTSTVKSND